MDTHYWNTEYPLITNSDTVQDYVKNELNHDDFYVHQINESSVEIESVESEKNYYVYVSGDGDVYSHKAEFIEIWS